MIRLASMIFPYTRLLTLKIDAIADAVLLMNIHFYSMNIAVKGKIYENS